MAKRILVAVIFVPILLVVMLFLPSVVMAAVVAFIAAMACFELLRATGEGKVSPPMEIAALLSAVAIPFGAWLNVGKMTVGACTFAVMAVAFWCAIRA
jgi:CDP-diglyceride synthetase